jgi:uncharacterized damage-inducible protein DinB
MKLFSLLLVASATMFAQSDPIAEDTKAMYMMTRSNLMKSAEKIPAELYSYRPTPEVRSIAELFGHIAEAQYLFCSPLKGEPKPDVKIEKVKTTKEDLTKALTEAFEYCDGAYNKATDSAMADKVKFFNRDRTKNGIMQFNSIHNYEHYGNLVTYMRMNKIVPPSSEGR